MKCDIKNIKILTLGSFDQSLLSEIKNEVSIEFDIDVIIVDVKLDIGVFYNASRGQYDGNDLIKYIESEYAEKQTKVIALFQVDLFIPILTYIFGQAFLGGNTAIASMFRLKNERYGIQADDNVLTQRFIKEIIHELGHTFGLIHCHLPKCVMMSSTYVEDIDQKSHAFCNKCSDFINDFQPLE